MFGNFRAYTLEAQGPFLELYRAILRRRVSPRFGPRVGSTRNPRTRDPIRKGRRPKCLREIQVDLLQDVTTVWDRKAVCQTGGPLGEILANTWRELCDRRAKTNQHRRVTHPRGMLEKL